MPSTRCAEFQAQTLCIQLYALLSTAVQVCVLTHQGRCPEELIRGDCIEAAEGPGPAAEGGAGAAWLEARGQAR